MLKCKDCPHWYGGEDYGYGSCRLKLQVKKKKFLTFGQQDFLPIKQLYLMVILKFYLVDTMTILELLETWNFFAE